jgi:hypothetical protein
LPVEPLAFSLAANDTISGHFFRRFEDRGWQEIAQNYTNSLTAEQ